MNQLVRELYKDYGKYINKFRSFPLVDDGLKIVERRILYSLYQIAKDNYVKSAKISGYTIGNYHPHSDSSVYDTMVQIVQGGLAIGQGNWGSKIGVNECDAAASRYTEIKCSKDILKTAFEFIKYSDYAELELDSEPISVPSKFPICLINKNNCQGIGFGSRTVIPSYTKADLLKRLKWLLGHRTSEPLIKPLTDCIMLSHDSEFKNLLTTGISKLDYQGIYEISDKSIIIKSLPPGKNFSKLFSQLEKEIQTEKSLGWTDETSGATGTKVRLTIIRPRMIDIKQLEKKIKKLLVGSITYECNMCDTEGRVILVPIDDMLMRCYNNYKRIVSKYLKDTISDLENKINEMELIKKIKIVLPTHLQQHPNDPDLIIQNCSNDTNIEVTVIKQLFDKYNISRLLRVQVDVESVRTEKQTFIDKLNNIDNFVWTDKYEGES